jgi:predicted AAA+ superfamily ATPase
MIPRTLLPILKNRFNQGKAIVLLGPRQVGKTTLIRACLKDAPFLFLNGDDPDVLAILNGAGTSRLTALLGKHTWVFIDEAQRIPHIGLISKMIVDQFPSVQLIISGSSALEINASTQEPLTGRKFEFFLFPVSWNELESHLGLMESAAQLEERLVFGMYPEIINHRNDAQERLKQLCNSYLYKDVLTITGIKKPELLDKLLKALALQLGNEVSYNELSQLLEIDKATVAKYIDILEKAFIVFRLTSFSRNLRNEIKNNRKIYFYDNGIRNMVINNLNPFDLRNDKGALWENFLISERIKQHSYNQTLAAYYFWRNTQQQEIDFIEERGGRIFAFEFKWKSRRKQKFPATFLAAYLAEAQIIDQSNFRDFICGGLSSL